ncbi:membrane-bound alkaline phosphatase-like [Armigeres subalbatus]|uniref:membrane-bound alkaline phosphatase-like n=1 Tax=Armigeres subalbatus TaxID=124917 RepID=UPI002ED2E485
MELKVLAVLYLFVAVDAQVLVEKTEHVLEWEHYHTRNHLQQKLKKNAYTEEETHSEFWLDSAQNKLRDKLAQKKSVTKAKNVIFFIGDGMSPQTVAATRAYLGNENESLSFEKFPHLGQAKTYCVNRQVPDSACTGTSYLSGVKVNYGMLNVVASIARYTCDYEKNNSTELDGLMKWAQDAGKATGIVTNTRITHATPAASYAKSATRGWEYDAAVVDDGCDPEKSIDIARQMVYNEVPKNFKVILGGGRRNFRPTDVRDEEGSSGYRTDGRDLIDEWSTVHEDMGTAAYVWNRTGLVELDLNNTDYLLGLFESNHMKYNLRVEEEDAASVEPTLSEMVEAAIKILRKSENGYVLFVEGGLIDLAHHETRARLALDETAEYSKAVNLARELTDEGDTLIVVSSDHSHTMTYNGYTKRGQDVLGIADISERDGLPYTTLSYANGPGYTDTYTDGNPAERIDITNIDYTQINQRYLATAPLSSEAHGGEDVTVYASGPFAHIFNGNYEQNTLPHLIAYAVSIGEYYDEQVEPPVDEDGGATSLSICLALLLAAVVATVAR